jgi:hypothetical protein
MAERKCEKHSADLEIVQEKFNAMKLFLTLLLSSSFFSLEAQNITGDSLKQQMIKDWERVT